jgi:hypothetical protein
MVRSPLWRYGNNRLGASPLALARRQWPTELSFRRATKPGLSTGRPLKVPRCRARMATSCSGSPIECSPSFVARRNWSRIRSPAGPDEHRIRRAQQRWTNGSPRGVSQAEPERDCAPRNEAPPTNALRQARRNKSDSAKGVPRDDGGY